MARRGAMLDIGKPVDRIIGWMGWVVGEVMRPELN